jgi:hypothetical protein
MSPNNQVCPRQRLVQSAEYFARHAPVAVTLAAVMLGAGVASADPVPANQCGAHTDALDCIRDTSTITPAEAQYAGQVGDLAKHLGTTMQAADQVLDEAMEADCSNLHVGADGVAR